MAQQEIQTAGEPKSIKLTVHTAPQGLQADGSDVAFIDFEVVDAKGRRCPTDEARVDFSVTGPVNWRGGFNAGKLNTTNNLYLDTECGINRVAIRSLGWRPADDHRGRPKGGARGGRGKSEEKGFRHHRPPSSPRPQHSQTFILKETHTRGTLSFLFFFLF